MRAWRPNSKQAVELGYARLSIRRWSPTDALKFPSQIVTVILLGAVGRPKFSLMGVSELCLEMSRLVDTISSVAVVSPSGTRDTSIAVC